MVNEKVNIDVLKSIFEDMLKMNQEGKILERNELLLDISAMCLTEVNKSLI